MLTCAAEAEASRKATGGRTGGGEHYLWAEDDPPPSLRTLLKVYKEARDLCLRQFIPDRLPVSSMAHPSLSLPSLFSPSRPSPSGLPGMRGQTVGATT